MLPEHICLKEHQWGVMEQTLKTILANQEKFENNVAAHVNEGEREGGFRDRIRELEAVATNLKAQVSVIKKGYWKTAVIAGVCSGVAARYPEIFGGLKWLLGIAFAQGN